MLIHVRQHRGRDMYGQLVGEKRDERSGKFVDEFSQATGASLCPISGSFFYCIVKKGSPDIVILSPAFPKMPSMEHKSHKISYHKRVPWANDFGQCPETQYILTSCEISLIVTHKKRCEKSFQEEIGLKFSQHFFQTIYFLNHFSMGTPLSIP